MYRLNIVRYLFILSFKINQVKSPLVKDWIKFFNKIKELPY